MSGSAIWDAIGSSSDEELEDAPAAAAPATTTPAAAPVATTTAPAAPAKPAATSGWNPGQQLFGFAQTAPSRTPAATTSTLGKRKAAEAGVEKAPANAPSVKVTKTSTNGGVSQGQKKGPLTDKDKAALLTQVEFYFGDSNLPTDEYMLNKLEGAEKWYPIADFCTFNKVKQITSSATALADALRTSKDLLQVSACGTKVRRTTPWPTKEELLGRSIFGFPVPRTLGAGAYEEVKKFFDVFGKVLSVRAIGKNFYHGAFVEYESKEVAEAVIARSQDKENPIKWNGKALKCGFRSEWDAAKAKHGKGKGKGKGEMSPKKKDKAFVADRIVKVEGADCRPYALKDYLGSLPGMEVAHVEWVQCTPSGKSGPAGPGNPSIKYARLAIDTPVSASQLLEKLLVPGAATVEDAGVLAKLKEGSYSVPNEEEQKKLWPELFRRPSFGGGRGRGGRRGRGKGGFRGRRRGRGGGRRGGGRGRGRRN